MADTIERILQEKGADVWSVSPGNTVYEAIEEMAHRSVGALLVIEGGRLVGIISERDYARKVILQGLSSKETMVSEIMTRSPITVTPEYTVDECMRVMSHYRIRHLPVVRGSEISGMVSIGDMVNAIISDQAQTIDHLHAYIIPRYPA